MRNTEQDPSEMPELQGRGKISLMCHSTGSLNTTFLFLLNLTYVLGFKYWRVLTYYINLDAIFYICVVCRGLNCWDAHLKITRPTLSSGYSASHPASCYVPDNASANWPSAWGPKGKWEIWVNLPAIDTGWLSTGQRRNVWSKSADEMFPFLLICFQWVK